MTTPNVTDKFEQKLDALIWGVKANFDSLEQGVCLGGQRTTLSAVLESLQTSRARLGCARLKRLASLQAAAERRRDLPEARALYQDATLLLRCCRGRENPTLGSFGLAVAMARKRLNTEAKLIAQARAAATRRARHRTVRQNEEAEPKAGLAE
jgi:hypothetical protein